MEGTRVNVDLRENITEQNCCVNLWLLIRKLIKYCGINSTKMV